MKDLTVDQYQVPAKFCRDEIKVKGSRFLTTIVPSADKKIAEQKYTEIKNEFYDATHNCFAYRIDEQISRYSDDGEPSGTAGKPILQAIDAFSLREVLCVVTRYFGGTKLGTGGLVRAYGDSARFVLNKTKIEIRTRFSEITVNYDYHFENTIRQLLSLYNGKIIDYNYTDQVSMWIAIPQSKQKLFRKELVEKTNNEIEIINVGS